MTETISILDVFSAIDKTKELEQQWKQSKDDIQSAAITCITNQNSEHAMMEIAGTIYWECKEVKAITIADCFGWGPNQVAKHLYPYQVGKCIWCDHAIYADAEYREKKVSDTKCKDCKKRELQERQEASNQAYAIREEQRQKRRQELLTMPYVEYLKTAEWQTKRFDALKRAKFHCSLCGLGGQLNVHHKSYERKGQELATDLVVLCQSCHAKFHDKLQEA